MRPIRANITTSDMPSHVASKHNHFILVYTAHQMKQFIPKSLLFHIQFPWVRSIYHETHTHLTAIFPGLPGWPSTRKVKPIWILPKQETVNGIGISWAICKPEPSSRQITTPAPHHLFFFTSRMPFLLHNQQCQSTEGLHIPWEHLITNHLRPCWRPYKDLL